MGSIGLCLLERRKRISMGNNATSARPPRTQPTMIPTLFKLDDELWAAADPEVLVILLVDEGPEVDEVVLSGSSILG